MFFAVREALSAYLLLTDWEAEGPMFLYLAPQGLFTQ